MDAQDALPARLLFIRLLSFLPTLERQSSCFAQSDFGFFRLQMDRLKLLNFWEGGDDLG